MKLYSLSNIIFFGSLLILSIKSISFGSNISAIINYDKFDIELYNAILNKVEKGDYGALTSLLIVSNDSLIGEYYFNGMKRDSVHTMQSVSKSITSILIGIAIDKGYITSVDEKLCDIFPEIDFSDSTGLKQTITIKDCLTMSAGFQWSEKYPSADKRSSLYELYRSDWDYINYFVSQPMIHSPGTNFEYNSGLSMILGAIIQRTTKMEVEKFAEEYLFKPLEIEYLWHNSVIWEGDSNGLAHCGGGLYIRPIDMAKIGMLIDNHGLWEKKQIVSSKWIEESTLPIIDASQKRRYREYGYQWWIYHPLFDLEPIIYADGYAGQNIFIVKEYNLIIVITGDLQKNAAASVPLMYDVLACHKDFKKHFMEFYNNCESKEYSDYKVEEYVSIAQNLIYYKKYIETVTHLSRYSSESENDWYYEFFIGTAYYYLKDKDKALYHLNLSLDNNNGDEWYLAPYKSNALEMIANIKKE